MTWHIDDPQGNEAAKIRWNLVPYMHGRVLDLGCGPFKAFHHFVGVDNGHHDAQFGWKNRADVIVDSCEDLGIFADASCDMVFSSHLLEHIDYEKVPAALNEWFRVLKVGGHMCLYVPDEDEYPKVGEKGANPDHKWNCNYERVCECLDRTNYDWDMVEFAKRNATNEYSLWFCVRKL
jgi:predicted SAM-dependent methyltransferase